MSDQKDDSNKLNKTKSDQKLSDLDEKIRKLRLKLDAKKARKDKRKVNKNVTSFSEINDPQIIALTDRMDLMNRFEEPDIKYGDIQSMKPSDKLAQKYSNLNLSSTELVSLIKVVK